MGRPARQWLVAKIGGSLDAAWHVLATLERIGITSWFPQIIQMITKNGRARRKISPLFPGYLFVKLPPARSRIVGVVNAIRATHGIFGILCTEQGGISLVANSVVEELQARAGADGYITPMSARLFVVGQPVRLLIGQFAGKYLGEAENGLCRVGYTLFGHDIEKLVEAAALVAA